MTTPERIKRRQLREFIAIVILSAGTIAWGVISDARDDDQDDCFREVISDLTESAKARSRAAKRHTELTDRSDQAQETLILEVFAATTREDTLTAFNKYNKMQKELDKERNEVDSIRADNPIPPFPTGECK